MLRIKDDKNFCPNLSSIMDDPIFIRILKRRKTGGSMRTTTYAVQLKIFDKYREIAFTWRPDVTHFWLSNRCVPKRDRQWQRE